MVALLVGARAGMHVLDACAGRGDEGAVVDAAELHLHPSKLGRLRQQPGGAAIHHTFAVDWSRGTGEVTGGYGRILGAAIHRRRSDGPWPQRQDPGTTVSEHWRFRKDALDRWLESANLGHDHGSA